METVNRQEFMLAAMSSAGTGLYSPVQVQKLFFLLDENIVKHWLGKPLFKFKPHHYGPFDKEVYWELEALAQEGLANVLGPESVGPRTYHLTDQGVERGKSAFETFGPATQEYISDLVAVIRNMSFTDLVSAVYREYPEMKVNSVFAQARS